MNKRFTATGALIALALMANISSAQSQIIDEETEVAPGLFTYILLILVAVPAIIVATCVLRCFVECCCPGL